jgi:hypothetical protein
MKLGSSGYLTKKCAGENIVDHSSCAQWGRIFL